MANQLRKFLFAKALLVRAKFMLDFFVGDWRNEYCKDQFVMLQQLGARCR